MLRLRGLEMLYKKKGLAFEIKQFSESTRTANEAAAVIGCCIDIQKITSGKIVSIK